MARDIARTDAFVASSYARKKVEMLFAQLVSEDVVEIPRSFAV
jgi:hypothetical protein